MKKLATLTGLVLLAVLAAGGPAIAAETKIVIDGSTTVGPIAKAFAEYYRTKCPDVNITVSESGSGNGAKSLINGTCDVADMSRFMKTKEFKAAVEKGIFPVAHVVAVDGIAIAVNKANPVAALTLDQVRGIYGGKITRWSQVGGPDKAIVVVGRDTNSGTYETFAKLVMRKQRVSPAAEVFGSNGAVRARVESTPAAIGYVGLGFVENVKPLKIGGIVPNRATIASGRYPIARPLFMFTNGYPKLGTRLHGFVTLHLSKTGQEIIEALGFIPVTRY